MKFIKDSLREFKHVVWPTREETKKYFVIVLIVLISFGLYLFIVGNIFSETLFGLKKLVGTSSESTVSEVNIPAIGTGAEDSVEETPAGETTTEVEPSAADIIETSIEENTVTDPSVTTEDEVADIDATEG